MGGVVSRVFGYHNALKQTEHAVGALQAEGVATLRNIQGQMSQFRQKFENELMPEMQHTMNVTRSAMQEMVNVSHQALERFSATLDKVDETVTTVKFGVEVLMIIFFLLIAKLCGSELNRIGQMLKPNAFYRLEKELLHILRLACIFSSLAIVSRVFYIVILQNTDATPIEILYLVFLPVVAVIAYKLLCLVVFVLSCIFYLLKFLLWSPFTFITYPIFYFFYLIVFAPTVWLYRVYRSRLRLKNQYGIFIMHSLVVILPFFYMKMVDIISYLKEHSLSSSVIVLYAVVATYTFYYLIALNIKICYPILSVQQQVREVHALRYQ